MRLFRHMVRGALNNSCPVVDVLYPHTALSVCWFQKGGESADSIIAVDAESIPRRRLRNMVMFARKNVGSGPKAEHL